MPAYSKTGQSLTRTARFRITNWLVSHTGVHFETSQETTADKGKEQVKKQEKAPKQSQKVCGTVADERV